MKKMPFQVRIGLKRWTSRIQDDKKLMNLLEKDTDMILQARTCHGNVNAMRDRDKEVVNGLREVIVQKLGSSIVTCIKTSQQVYKKNANTSFQTCPVVIRK